VENRAIDIAKALARLSEVTIFELRGEWRRLPTAFGSPFRSKILGRRIAGSYAPIVGLTANLTPRKCPGFMRQIAFVTAATATLSPIDFEAILKVQRVRVP
jgi:hypothetical protein